MIPYPKLQELVSYGANVELSSPIPKRELEEVLSIAAGSGATITVSAAGYSYTDLEELAAIGRNHLTLKA